jgi:type I restriction enzyme, S subunit
MSEWKEYKLSDLAQLQKDSWKVGDEELPYIALEHIVENGLRIQGIGDSNTVASNKYYFDSDCFLFGKLRPYFRKLYRPNFKGICSTDIWVVKPKGKNNKDFLFYFFANQEFIDFSYSGSSGTRMPRADWNFVAETKWRFPEPNEQNAISELLSSLDDKIDILHRQNISLEALAATLFRQKIVEEAIDEWEFEKLEEIAEVQNGYAFSSKNYVEYQPGNLEVLKMGHIERGGGLRTNPKKDYVPREKNLERWILNKGDIVMAMTDMKDNVVILGVPAMIDKEDNYVLNQRVARIYLKSNKKLLNNYLLYIQLKDSDFIANLQSKANSGVQVNLSTAAIKESDIIIPPIEVQNEIGNTITDLYLKKENNDMQIQTLAKLRDTLLPKLMSGEFKLDINE